MARVQEFYKGKRKRRNYAVLPFLIFLAVVSVLLVLFYGMQKYAVISKDGVAIRLPILEDGPTETVDSEGWLHSGDLAVRDENGNYRITGRLKDMIIRGGENIYPKEIEEFIYTHPKVQDVQVIGVPDKKYGEEAYAAIILKEGESMTEEEMRTYIMDHMARHKVPRYITFTDSFPMNAAGKILKYKMREEAAKALNLE